MSLDSRCGVPSSRSMMTFRIRCSSRPWGDPPNVPNSEAHDVLPAHAGVIRTRSSTTTRSPGAPHTCGGDPNTMVYWWNTALCSLHTRGVRLNSASKELGSDCREQQADHVVLMVPRPVTGVGNPAPRLCSAGAPPLEVGGDSQAALLDRQVKHLTWRCRRITRVSTARPSVLSECSSISHETSTWHPASSHWCT